jgi:hypothetical protein
MVMEFIGNLSPFHQTLQLQRCHCGEKVDETLWRGIGVHSFDYLVLCERLISMRPQEVKDELTRATDNFTLPKFVGRYWHEKINAFSFIYYCLVDAMLTESKWLRSWVQIPPGPFFRIQKSFSVSRRERKVSA